MRMRICAAGTPDVIPDGSMPAHGMRWYIHHTGEPCAPSEALPEDHMPGVIHADDVKDELGEIDAEYADGLCHGTCLLWVNGCLLYRNHSG